MPWKPTVTASLAVAAAALRGVSDLRTWLFSAPQRLRGVVLAFRSRAMSATTAIPAIGALCAPPPPRPFLLFVANKGTSSNRPLGDPCVTLGWPLGHAWATQGPSNPRPNPKQAEGRRFWVCVLAKS